MNARTSIRVRVACVLLGLVGVLSRARAQEAPSLGPSLDAIVQRLNAEDDAVQRQVASALHLADPILGEPCTELDHAELRDFALAPGVESRLLFLKSTFCESWFLVPIVRRGGQWHSLPPIALWAKFSQPSFRVESLLHPGEQELVASNVTIDEGTGVLQRNTTIFKVRGETVQIIFDQPEYSHMFEPLQKGSHYEEEQTSSFSFRRDDSGVTYILETRKQSVGKQRIMVYREYDWNAQLFLFRMVGAAP